MVLSILAGRLTPRKNHQTSVQVYHRRKRVDENLPTAAPPLVLVVVQEQAATARRGGHLLPPREGAQTQEVDQGVSGRSPPQ